MKFKIRILLLTLIFSGCEQEYPENFYDQKPQEKLASTESHHDFIQRISYRTASAEVLKKPQGLIKRKTYSGPVPRKIK